MRRNCIKTVSIIPFLYFSVIEKVRNHQGQWSSSLKPTPMRFGEVEITSSNFTLSNIARKKLLSLRFDGRWLLRICWAFDGTAYVDGVSVSTDCLVLPIYLCLNRKTRISHSRMLGMFITTALLFTKYKGGS